MLGMVSMPNGTVGVEGAGVITSIDKSDEKFSFGDRVFGWVGSNFCSYAVNKIQSMLHATNGMSFEEVSTIYTARHTADFASGPYSSYMTHGHTVLVHTATGSVGIAAVTIAQLRNATIMATAGAHRKRAWLRDQGVQMVSNSRNAEQFLQDLSIWLGSNNQAIDIVLNALSNDFITMSFNHMRPGGTFTELGKRAIWPLELASSCRSDVSYLPMDETVVEPHLHHTLLSLEKHAQLNRDATIPMMVFSSEDCSAAFQYLRMASHIGKVVISMSASMHVQAKHPEVHVELTEFVSSLQQSDPSQVEEATLTLILQSVAEVVADCNIGRHDPLMESGVDSLAATELTHCLQQQLGTAAKLPSTLVFDYPSCSAIALYVSQQIDISNTATDITTNTAVKVQPIMESVHRETSAAVAVTGIFCLAPGTVQTPGSHWWHMLSCAKDEIQLIPATRFDVQVLDSEASRCGHFVEAVELFDSVFFRMSATEVRNTDPTHRLLLEVAFGGFTAAGYTRGALEGAATGVFVGPSVGDWEMLKRDLGQAVSIYSVHGSDAAATAGRVAYLFGLKGPCFSLSTMCSSSLVALDAAHTSTKLRQCNSALAVGVNLTLHHSGWRAVGALSALAPNGCCKTFDGSANGYVLPCL